MLSPTSEGELAEAVAAAAAGRRPLEIAGGGSRRGLGRPVQAAETLSVAGLSGITLYEPGALTLVAKAGTPLCEIDAALGAEGQRLAFEPMDHRAVLAGEGVPTIGGVVATGASGPRRIQSGACRDALLGLRFVDGRGTVLKNGGRVMKNVTGYDLAKLLAGSHGTLGVLSEVSLKLQPMPERELTLAYEGLDAARAMALLSAALATPFAVTGAAHLPGDVAPEGRAVTAVRLEGMADQAAYRAARLTADLSAFGAPRELDSAAHGAFWPAVRNATPFAGRAGAVWRLSLRPSEAPEAVAALASHGDVSAFFDWGGALTWLLVPEGQDAMAALVRAETARRGGHATLIRAAEPVRAAVEVFEPEAAALAAISAGLRRQFDPEGILNPGRIRA